MTTTHPASTLVGLDREDGLPVWAVAPGAGLVAHVRVVERLGVGHRCETWLGRSADLGTPVVVKLARPHQVDHPRARLTLEREVRALENTLHPGLPRLYVDATTAAVPYVLTEYVDGLALDQTRRWFHRRSPAVARLGADLLAALVPLHARGLAHLDLKPDNVMLRHGRPVLIDFGSSRALGSLQPPGRPVGTFGWAPPEMEACEPVSAAMDLYGVGRVLRHALGPRRRLARALDWRRTGLDAIIEALLSDDPADRPDLPTALELLPGGSAPR